MRTATFVVLLALASAASGQNLVPNGEFDTQLPPWSGSSPSWTAAWDSADLTGSPTSGSARIQWLHAGDNPIVIAEQTLSTSLPLSVAGVQQAYTLGARFRILANTPDRPLQALTVAIFFFDAHGQEIGNGSASTCQLAANCHLPASGDVQVEEPVVAPPGTAFAQISIFVPPTPGFTVLVDDVHLTQQTVAPTFSAWGYGVLALLLAVLGVWRTK